jgi:hypothetical protein
MCIINSEIFPRFELDQSLAFSRGLLGWLLGRFLTVAFWTAIRGIVFHRTVIFGWHCFSFKLLDREIAAFHGTARKCDFPF